MGVRFQDITNISNQQIKVTIHRKQHRDLLYKWLYEVTLDFKYNLTTYISAILICEEFTNKYTFTMVEYQLLGITSLYIAAKLEETTTKPVKYYEYVTDSTCTISDIRKKEIEILDYLDYNLFSILFPTFTDSSLILEKLNQIPEINVEIKLDLFCCILADFLIKEGIKQNIEILKHKSLEKTKLILFTKTLTDDILFFVKTNSKLSVF